MIKIDEVETYGWQAAIRGMRNPKNSWDKSDTTQCCGCDKDCASFNNKLCVGNADLTLMETLGAAGTDHGKYLRMITVTADITAPPVLVEGIRHLQGRYCSKFLFHHAQNPGEGVCSE